MYCANCGSQIIEGAKFCIECGTPVPKKEPIILSTREEEIKKIIKELKKKVWYYFVDLKAEGPVTEEELNQLFEEGTISSFTTIWHIEADDAILYENKDAVTEEVSVEETVESFVEESGESEDEAEVYDEPEITEAAEEGSAADFEEPEESETETEAVIEEKSEEAEEEAFFEESDQGEKDTEPETVISAEDEIVEESETDLEKPEETEQVQNKEEIVEAEPVEEMQDEPETDSEPDDEAKWYYVDSRHERRGPVTEKFLRFLLDEGLIHERTYIWAPGMGSLVYLKDVLFSRNQELEPEEAEETETVAADSYWEEEPEQEEAEQTQKTEEVAQAESEEEEIHEDESEEVEEIETVVVDSNWEEESEETEQVQNTEEVIEAELVEEEIQEEPEEEAKWYYVDGMHERRGPVTSSHLNSLMQEGVVNEKTYIWTPGMESWIFFKDSELFSKQEEAQPEELNEEASSFNTAESEKKDDEKWYYVDRTNTRQGPVDSNRLRSLIQEGEIHDRTYLWSPGMASWTFLKDIGLFLEEEPEEVAEAVADQEIKQEETEQVQNTEEVNEEVQEEKEAEKQDDVKWYYVDRTNTRQGPVDSNRLRSLIQEGVIHDRTYIWTSGMAGWALVKDTAFRQPEQEETKDWYYIDAQRIRQGKFSDSEMEALLQAGSITKNTYVWKSGMPQWALLSTTLLSKYAPESESETDDTLWFYRGRDNSRVGPFSRKEIEDLLNKGSITAQTDVWTKGMANWKPLSATPLAHAETQTEVEWYIQSNGQTMGPYPQSTILHMLRNKEINARTYVWTSGMADWEQLKNTSLSNMK